LKKFRKSDKSQYPKGAGFSRLEVKGWLGVDTTPRGLGSKLKQNVSFIGCFTKRQVKNDA
jgi:hypothetical protein